jgi:hypothetical protein
VEGRVAVRSSLFGGASVLIRERLDAVSELRLRETYHSLTVLGRDVALPETLQYSRELYVTYVDGDLLVIRDASGVPAFFFRKRRTSRNWGTEPTSVDDELAR